MPSNWVETSVDVPYGQIACKVWGSKCDDSVNIVALHGFMDNCGSFDQLIPLLENDYFIVAVDFPGHGFSSHLPAGIAYTDSTWILAVEAVIAHFEFEKIIFISHSMGSTVALYYATLFPERVTKIIAFDTLLATIHPMECIPKEMAKSYKYFCDLQNKKANVTPSFDPKMAVRLLIAAHKTFGDLDEAAAKILLRRSTKLADDKQRVVFTRDERLNCTLSTLPFKSNFDILKGYYKNLKCDILVLRGRAGIIQIEHPKIIEMIEILKKQCPRFEMISIKGGHFGVLTHFDEAVSAIHDFIEF